MFSMKPIPRFAASGSSAARQVRRMSCNSISVAGGGSWALERRLANWSMALISRESMSQRAAIRPITSKASSGILPQNPPSSTCVLAWMAAKGALS